MSAILRALCAPRGAFKNVARSGGVRSPHIPPLRTLAPSQSPDDSVSWRGMSNSFAEVLG
jgi:hypothetical protein